MRHASAGDVVQEEDVDNTDPARGHDRLHDTFHRQVRDLLAVHVSQPRSVPLPPLSCMSLSTLPPRVLSIVIAPSFSARCNRSLCVPTTR